MQKHTNRLIVAAVLIAAAAIGGFFVFTAHQRTAVIDAAANDVAVANAKAVMANQQASSAASRINVPLTSATTLALPAP